MIDNESTIITESLNDKIQIFTDKTTRSIKYKT